MSDSSALNLSFVWELAVLVWPLWFVLLLYGIAALGAGSGMRRVMRYHGDRRTNLPRRLRRPLRIVSKSTPLRPQYRVGNVLWYCFGRDVIITSENRKDCRTPRDFAACEFLADLECCVEPLVCFRDDFRRLIHDQPVAGLVWCLRDPSPWEDPLWEDNLRLQWMVVWLLGRCGNTRAIATVAGFRHSEDRRLRITVARSLARLRARGELQELADSDPDPWIRQFAARHARRSFADQLESFTPNLRLENEAGRELPRSKMPFVLNVQPLIRRPPKSAEVIRMTLQRIRDLLHGPSRVGNGH